MVRLKCRLHVIGRMENELSRRRNYHHGYLHPNKKGGDEMITIIINVEENKDLGILINVKTPERPNPTDNEKSAAATLMQALQTLLNYGDSENPPVPDNKS